MNANYSDSYTSPDYDYGYDNGEKKANGLGTYHGKAYSGTRTPLYRANGVQLDEITEGTTCYEIVWDGEVLNRYPTLAKAVSYFIDFSGIRKSQLKKAAL